MTLKDILNKKLTRDERFQLDLDKQESIGLLKNIIDIIFREDTKDLVRKINHMIVCRDKDNMVYPDKYFE